MFGDKDLDRARGCQRGEAPGAGLSVSPTTPLRERGPPAALRSGPGEWASPCPGPTSPCSERAFVEQMEQPPDGRGPRQLPREMSFQTLRASSRLVSLVRAVSRELEAEAPERSPAQPPRHPRPRPPHLCLSGGHPDERAAILQDA